MQNDYVEFWTPGGIYNALWFKKKNIKGTILEAF